MGLRLFHRNSADEPIALPNLSAQALIQLLSGCYCLRVADRFNDLDGLDSARAIQAEHTVTSHTEPPRVQVQVMLAYNPLGIHMDQAGEKGRSPLRERTALLGILRT